MRPVIPPSLAKAVAWATEKDRHVSGMCRKYGPGKHGDEPRAAMSDGED
jgi:hypothetical protein